MNAYDFLVQMDNANILPLGGVYQIQNLGVHKLSTLSKLTP